MNLTYRCILCVLSASLFSFLFSVGLLGQEPKKKVVYKEVSYYKFENVLVKGNQRNPDGTFIYRKQQTPFSSSLGLKRSFIPELKSSAKTVR